MMGAGVARHGLRSAIVLLLPLCFAVVADAASPPAKVHVISFGKAIPVQWLPDTAADKPIPLKVRPLVVDGRIKEYTLGPPHEVTDRLFVIRRAFRVNDSLPEDSAVRWQWQRGGWLVVDRLTGHVAALNLPEFDAFYSAASWYRDYAAYCGVSDDGKKLYAIVAQLNRRKPVLKKPLAATLADDAPPDSACPAPAWQRAPARVTFEPAGAAKETFAIRGHIVDVVNDAEEDDDEGAK